MTPKIKMFLIYAFCFIALFMLVWWIVSLIVTEESMISKLAPIAISIIFAPKPHIEEHSGKRKYGLKTILSKKIYWVY